MGGPSVRLGGDLGHLGKIWDPQVRPEGIRETPGEDLGTPSETRRDLGGSGKDLGRIWGDFGTPR